MSLEAGHVSLERGRVSLEGVGLSLERDRVSLEAGHVSLEGRRVSLEGVCGCGWERERERERGEIRPTRRHCVMALRSSISSTLGTTMRSQRRFFWRPSSVSLVATGSVSAKPAALQCCAGRPEPLSPTR